MYMPLHVNTYCVSLNDQIMARVALRDKKTSHDTPAFLRLKNSPEPIIVPIDCKSRTIPFRVDDL